MVVFNSGFRKWHYCLAVILMMLVAIFVSAETITTPVTSPQPAKGQGSLYTSHSNGPDLQREPELILEYRCRYHCNPNYPDHLLSVIQVSEDRLVIGGNQGLVLIDQTALLPEGTDSLLNRMTGLNALELYLYQQNYLFVNLNGTGVNQEAGFAVVRIDGNTLTPITIVSSTNYFMEKMTISGHYLYIAAHSGGLLIYDISDPELPVYCSSIQAGLLDAFAVAVAGDSAYVADGAGGLKVVDVSDRYFPQLVAGETIVTATGTAQDVTCRNGKVFVAAGAAGVAVYEGADLSSRSMIETGGVARSFCWIEYKLAVSTVHGVVILQETEGEYQPVTGEIMGRRGTLARLRLSNAIGNADNNLLLCANWNSMDVYELVEYEAGTQPDINCLPQRVRFHPDGGSIPALLWNNGAANLEINGVNTAPSSFSTNLQPLTVVPGDTVEFQISYDGSAAQGSGMIRILSNDPDESPYPIQLFGDTGFLDPGDQATDFTLPLYSRDHQMGTYSWESVTLSQHLGKVIWFQVYGSW